MAAESMDFNLPYCYFSLHFGASKMFFGKPF